MFDPKSPETVGYHLFLEPEGELRAELDRCIGKLADENDGPRFSPHVTLLARIERDDAEHMAEELARSLKPFVITLAGLAGEEEYYRALYMRVEGGGAADAHEKASALFSIPDERPYLPHLSLFYGNITDEHRLRLIQTTESPAGASFIASSLHLYETPGAPHEWRRIAEFPFGGR